MSTAVDDEIIEMDNRANDTIDESSTMEVLRLVMIYFIDVAKINIKSFTENDLFKDTIKWYPNEIEGRSHEMFLLKTDHPFYYLLTSQRWEKKNWFIDHFLPKRNQAHKVKEEFQKIIHVGDGKYLLQLVDGEALKIITNTLIEKWEEFGYIKVTSKQPERESQDQSSENIMPPLVTSQENTIYMDNPAGQLMKKWSQSEKSGEADIHANGKEPLNTKNPSHTYIVTNFFMKMNYKPQKTKEPTIKDEKNISTQSGMRDLFFFFCSYSKEPKKEERNDTKVEQKPTIIVTNTNMTSTSITTTTTTTVTNGKPENTTTLSEKY